MGKKIESSTQLPNKEIKSYDEIERKEEKLELIKNLKEIDDIDRTEENVEELIELVKIVCIQYRELYVKPYFGAFSEHFSPLVFNSYVPSESLGFYQTDTDHVVINVANFKQERLLHYGSILLHVLDYMACVGHEYEHNFQYKAGKFIDKIITDKKHFKSNVASLIDKYAYEIVDSAHNFEINKEDLKAILEITDLKSIYKHKSPNLSDDEHLDHLANAIYYNRYIEMDARAVERQIFESFVDELSVLDENKNTNTNIKGLAEYKISNDITNEQYWISNFFYQNYVDAIRNIDLHIARYMQNIYEASQKEYYAALKQYIDNGTKMPNAFCVLENDILHKVFDLVCQGFSADFTRKGIIPDYTNNVTNLRLYFANEGLWLFSSYLCEQFPHSSYYDSAYNQKYFNMLKGGNITFDSFFDVGCFTEEDIFDLLSTYLVRGQTKFCSSLLYELEDETIKKVLSKSDSSLLNEINARLNLLSKADLHNKQGVCFNGKKGTFDDIDDMISLLAQLCSSLHVPYYLENLQADEIKKLCKNEQEQKIKEELYRLYVKAEDIAKKVATKMEGRELRPDEYRFAHPQDREYYKLNKEESDVRFESLYGMRAFLHEEYSERMPQDASEVLHTT